MDELKYIQMSYPGQIATLAPVVKAFHDEVPARYLRGVGFDPAGFCAFMAATANSGFGAVFAASDEAGTPQGFLYGVCYPDTFLGLNVCSESHWYMMEAYRGSGLALLRMFEDWGRARGARLITAGHFPFVAGAKMKAMYERLGFLHFQEQYAKEL